MESIAISKTWIKNQVVVLKRTNPQELHTQTPQSIYWDNTLQNAFYWQQGISSGVAYWS